MALYSCIKMNSYSSINFLSYWISFTDYFLLQFSLGALHSMALNKNVPHHDVFNHLIFQNVILFVKQSPIMYFTLFPKKCFTNRKPYHGLVVSNILLDHSYYNQLDPHQVTLNCPLVHN